MSCTQVCLFFTERIYSGISAVPGGLLGLGLWCSRKVTRSFFSPSSLSCKRRGITPPPPPSPRCTTYTQSPDAAGVLAGVSRCHAQPWAPGGLWKRRVPRPGSTEATLNHRPGLQTMEGHSGQGSGLRQKLQGR